jgi:hypothetical protein
LCDNDLRKEIDRKEQVLADIDSFAYRHIISGCFFFIASTSG